MDAALFVESGWFAIDARNRRVPGVVVPSLDAGLSLVGRGAVATIVGRLRPEVVVVDIDLAGEAGWAAAESLMGWCTREGVWCLVRPSGGAEGRTHVFIAPEGRRKALEQFLIGVRVAHRGSASSIDLRSTVRPLSAPHRFGTKTAPYDAAAALARLRDLAWFTAKRVLRRSTTKKKASKRPPVAALEPSRRRERRELPQPWQHFLDTGERPPLRPPTPSAPEHTRSTWEAIATATMLRAGWTVDEAWKAIQRAHLTAMDHARSDRRRWVQWVWNRAVLDDADYRPPRPSNPAVETAVAHARARLRTIAWSMSRRRRHALLLVGHAVLDRMARTGNLRVPCPERDLVLDTGLTDRTTIRSQLRLLNGELGQLHRAFDPQQRQTSSFEFEIPRTPAEEPGVLQIPPPSHHTPRPAPPPPHCPPCSSHLLRALRELARPADLPTVARRSQLTPSPTTEPSPSQIRTIRSGLLALAQVGLAHCTEGGEWLARDGLEPAAEAASRLRHDELAARVQAERAAYRAGASTAWNAARAAALKGNRARERAWWDGLSEQEQRERRSHWQGRFARLSVHEQAQLKASLAERDARAGVDVARRHDQWVNAMHGLTLAQRSVRRASEFAGLSAPLRVAYARAWQEHRDRFGIACGTPTATTQRELALTLPQSSASRDEDFMQKQLPELDEQFLGA